MAANAWQCATCIYTDRLLALPDHGCHTCTVCIHKSFVSHSTVLFYPVMRAMCVHCAFIYHSPAKVQFYPVVCAMGVQCALTHHLPATVQFYAVIGAMCVQRAFMYHLPAKVQRYPVLTSSNGCATCLHWHLARRGTYLWCIIWHFEDTLQFGVHQTLWRSVLPLKQHSHHSKQRTVNFWAKQSHTQERSHNHISAT